MKKIFRQRTLLLFMGMAIYSGCAKQPLVTSDKPMGGPAQSAVQTGAKSTPAQEKPAAVAASSATAPVAEQIQKKAKGSESAATATDLQSALQKIYFDFDSSKLSDASRQTLATNYEVLKKNTSIRIRIEGNCDEHGSDEYNLALGERRAQAAANYLNKMGIPGERISTISYGKEKPTDPGHDENAWAKNRRDEFVIVQ